MRYLGGKSKYADEIAAHVNAGRAGRVVWDAFCGGLACAERIGGPILCTDVNPALIAMYWHYQAGWRPPEFVSHATRDAARDLPDHDPMKAFARIGAGFGGDAFAGYADKAGESARSLARTFAALGDGVVFDVCDFLEVEPTSMDVILYLDPPYRGARGYGPGSRDAFPSWRFAERVAEWARYVPVYVSERDFPCVGARVVWESERGGYMPGRARRVERLYKVGDCQ